MTVASNLAQITEKLLSDSISLTELKSTLFEYKSLLLNATSLELGLSSNQSEIHLERGLAIGLDWAASCLDDPVRTRKFIRGTKAAVDQKLHEGKELVHLLYAGTGPFATLILPLLSHYSVDQLKVTLLDVNPQSIENVSEIIEHFGFQNQVNEIRCADATKTIFENASTFDILLSETMQHALQRELQILISHHLLNQMSKDAILIPQAIDLDLVLIDSLNTQNEPEKIDDLMHVDADFLRSQGPIQSNTFFEKRIDLTGLNKNQEGYLAISTAIQTFENERIEWNESGLTSHKVVAPMSDFSGKSSIALKYAIKPQLGFQIVRD